MMLGRWILGGLAAGLWLGTAQAAPLPVQTAIGAEASGIEKVQFFEFFDDDPPPPPRYYYPPPPPPPAYYGPPRGGYYPPPPPGYRPPPPPAYGYYDGGSRKEAMKDYVKAQRQNQKEIQKERARAWNRANGF